jgi:hypothetical protein
MASSGIKFKPDFLKIARLVYKLVGRKTYRQHGDIISLLLSLRKGSRCQKESDVLCNI